MDRIGIIGVAKTEAAWAEMKHHTPLNKFSGGDDDGFVAGTQHMPHGRAHSLGSTSRVSVITTTGNLEKASVMLVHS